VKPVTGFSPLCEGYQITSAESGFGGHNREKRREYVGNKTSFLIMI
jgi:hypothetical protein